MADPATLLSVDPEELRQETERLQSWSGLRTVGTAPQSRLDRAAQDRATRLDAFEREREERIRAAETRRAEDAAAHEARRIARARAQLDAVEDMEAIRTRITTRQKAKRRANRTYFAAVVLLPWMLYTAYLGAFAPRFYAATARYAVSGTMPQPDTSPLLGNLSINAATTAAYRLKAALLAPENLDEFARTTGLEIAGRPAMFADWITASVHAQEGFVEVTTLQRSPDSSRLFAEAILQFATKYVGAIEILSPPIASAVPALPNIPTSSLLAFISLLGAFLAVSLLRAGLAHHSKPF